MQLLEKETDRLVVPRLQVASTAWERMKGLLGRKGLDEDEALLIRNCASIHMFFMRFAIDAVFLDCEMQIVKLVENIRPWRIAGCLRACQVLEAPCGMIKRTDLTHGMYLRIAHREQPIEGQNE